MIKNIILFLVTGSASANPFGGVTTGMNNKVAAELNDNVDDVGLDSQGVGLNLGVTAPALDLEFRRRPNDLPKPGQ